MAKIPAGKGIDTRGVVFSALCLLPALVFLCIFLYYPIEETFRLSLMRSNGLTAPVFIGLENYRKLFVDPEFLAGLQHVFTWAFFSVLIQLPLAFLIAFGLTYNKNRFTGPLKAVYYLANVLPTAITAMLGKFIFSSNTGIIPAIARSLDIGWLKNMDFFGDPSLAFWTVFAIATWTYTGFPIVYLMASIEQMSDSIREAAALDGATGFRYAWHILLPSLSYPFRILAILATVGSLKLFDLPYMLTQGGPGDTTVTLGISLYRHGFVNWQYGKAATIGVVIFILSLVFTVFQFSFGNKKGSES